MKISRKRDNAISTMLLPLMKRTAVLKHENRNAKQRWKTTEGERLVIPRFVECCGSTEFLDHKAKIYIGKRSRIMVWCLNAEASQELNIQVSLRP